MDATKLLPEVPVKQLFLRTNENQPTRSSLPKSPTTVNKHPYLHPTPSPSPGLTACSGESSNSSPDEDEPLQLPMIRISNEETGEERSLCFKIPKPFSPFVYPDWTVKYELEPVDGTPGLIVVNDDTYKAPHKYVWLPLAQPLSQDFPLLTLGDKITQKQRAIRRAAAAKPESTLDRIVLRSLNGRFPLPKACIRSSEKILRALGITFVEYQNGQPYESFFSTDSILSITGDVVFCPMSLDHSPITGIQTDMEEYLEDYKKHLLATFMITGKIATNTGTHGAISLYCLSDFVRFVSFLARKHGGCILKVEKRVPGIKFDEKRKTFRSGHRF